MTVSRPDPERVRFDFFNRNRWCAPRAFHWEEGRCHYEFTKGHHPARTGPRVMSTLERVWDGPRVGKLDINSYRKYVRCPNVVWDHLVNLTRVNQVYGDCTWENIILGDRVVLIDPGHHRDFVCEENDLGKLLQSQRGWERVKAGGEGVDCPWPAKRIVAAYVTHLCRLLRHKHSEWCLLWARKELDLATAYLLD